MMAHEGLGKYSQILKLTKIGRAYNNALGYLKSPKDLDVRYTSKNNLVASFIDDKMQH